MASGEQPVMKISNEELDFLISREFPNDKEVVRTKLNKIKYDSENGKNRISTSVLQLADRDLQKIDLLVERANEDFRDIVSKAEYPRAYKSGLELFDQEERIIREVLLADREEFLAWKGKK